MDESLISYYNYKCYQNLKERLGLFDAVIECNELALREFILNSKIAESPKEYIKSLSSKHSIKVDSVDTQLLHSRIRHFYIMSVSQQADQFFDEFREEHKKINNSEWGDRNKGETNLDYILRTLFLTLENGKAKIGIELYTCYEYYRKIRNRFAHSDNDDDKVDEEFKKVQVFKEWYQELYKVSNSPKLYDFIDFDDFKLFSNIIKAIAFKLCVHLKPTLENIAVEIIRQSNIKPLNKSVPKVDFKSFQRIRNKPNRYINAFTNFINTHFGRFKKSDILALDKLINNAV